MISNLSLHIYAQMKDIFLPVAARDDGGMLGRDPPPLVPWLPFMWDSGVGAYAEDTLTGLTIGVPEKDLVVIIWLSDIINV